MKKSTAGASRDEMLKSVSTATRLSAARDFRELSLALDAFISEFMEKERSAKSQSAQEFAADAAFVFGLVSAKLRTFNAKLSAQSQPVVVSGLLQDVVDVLVAIQNMPDGLGGQRLRVTAKLEVLQP